ncbi:sigma-70 family RNA polymerase sigma factor [Nocardia sp. BMG111209]|uniref:sigma-70 family RNA polymerase sigma factor n=1 Tax=Nocardia sp. BMG111209 TaxID=1160137 RepID=UPI0003A0FF95
MTGDARPHEAGTIASVRQALDHLAPDERDALELVHQHRLSIAEVADVFRIPEGRAGRLLMRAQENLVAGASAVMIAGEGTGECADLAGVVDTADDEFTVLTRRVNRHVRQCSVCAAGEARRVRPAELIAVVPLLIPAGRARADDAVRLVAETRPAGGPSPESERAGPYDRFGFPRPPDRRRRLRIAFVVFAAAALLATAAVAASALALSGHAPQTPPAAVEPAAPTPGLAPTPTRPPTSGAVPPPTSRVAAPPASGVGAPPPPSVMPGAPQPNQSPGEQDSPPVPNPAPPAAGPQPVPEPPAAPPNPQPVPNPQPAPNPPAPVPNQPQPAPVPNQPPPAPGPNQPPPGPNPNQPPPAKNLNQPPPGPDPQPPAHQPDRKQSPPQPNPQPPVHQPDRKQPPPQPDPQPEPNRPAPQPNPNPNPNPAPNPQPATPQSCTVDQYWDPVTKTCKLAPG